MTTIEIEIDGKKLSATPDQMIIQVADDADIYIPRFCYHKHLSIAANCRMCLVEVEKSGKPLPACATPCTAGMKVFTRSPKALAAQKSVMEFLLINHPLDCPICDQGGECELQDLAMGFGSAKSFYTQGKRSVKDKDIGPLVATDMTRCIHCTRCVRFGEEVAGLRELGATGRGEHMEIGTYIQHAMKSEVSGNIIDLCPVGALTSKPFRFQARAWELNQYATIAPHDCLGSNLYVHTRSNKVMRVVPRENKLVNDTWISDRDRYSYEGLYHEERLEKPRIKRDGIWQDVDWQTALEFAANGIKKVIDDSEADQLAALASPSSTLEEFYLLQKLLRMLGSSNVDHRLRQTDFSDQQNFPAFPGLNIPVAELEQCDAILLIGSNIQKEQPVAALRIRKAWRNGAQVMAVNPLDYGFHFALATKKIIAPHELIAALAGVAKMLTLKTQSAIPEQLKKLLAEINPTAVDAGIAEKLSQGKKSVIILGALALNHPEASHVRALAQWIATATQSHFGFLTEGANSAGAWLAGAIPHRDVANKSLTKSGLDSAAIFSQPRQAYLLLNVEPDLDCANPAAAIDALKQAKFVVSCNLFNHAILNDLADVILPIAAFAETSGTYVNATGQWQSFAGVAAPFAEARPAWKVLRVLGNLFGLTGFDYASSEEIRDELKKLVDVMPATPAATFANYPVKSSAGHKFTRIGEVPIYAGDNLVRHADALQKTQKILEGEIAVVRLNADSAAALKVKAGDEVTVKQGAEKIRLPVLIDERVPANAALVAATNVLGELFGEVEIKKC